MSLTTDFDHPGLQFGTDVTPSKMASVYLVLSRDEIRKGYLKPLRVSYIHICGSETTMNPEIAQTYARDPWFYGGNYCVNCRMHRPLNEFKWPDGESMDPSKWPEEEHRRIADLKEGKIRAWLVEADDEGRTLFLCNDGEWCSSAEHAMRFQSALAANTKAQSITCMQARVSEHVWEMASSNV